MICLNIYSYNYHSYTIGKSLSFLQRLNLCQIIFLKIAVKISLSAVKGQVLQSN